jgi:hypothetical protein
MPQIFGEILVRLIHKNIITMPTTKVKLHIKTFEILIKDQNNPSNHHKIQKPITLQRLKYRCGLNFCQLSISLCPWLHFALILKTKPHTRAIQLENPAVSQTKNATPIVGDVNLSLLQKSNQDFFNMR